MAKVFTISEGLENLGAMKTGGQGSVYKGRRIGEIITAIKILPTPIFSESAEDKNYISFQNEVQKLKKVNETPNPNVVKILSSGVTDSGNFPFIEMEYIEGPDLQDFLKPPHQPFFTIKDALKVTDQLSHALAHCHRIDVRHGDIKSNNIKFNTSTGNYVLLDFGMAIMSDEQRRTSMRHAGAVEFMAPEQNEGIILFETDVYSFGVVIYEILTGTVPFPIKGVGETARNKVMISHMEVPPPDLLQLRREAMPPEWSADKRQHEMHLPEWLISMVYKCLEKNPEHRFKNGVELCDYVTRNSIITASKKEWIDDRITLLQQENERLMREKEQLQERLLEKDGRLSSNIISPVTVVADDVALPGRVESDGKNLSRNRVFGVLFLVIAICIAGYLWWNNNKINQEVERAPVTEANNTEISPKQQITPDQKAQLAKARTFMNNNQVAEALAIYRSLLQQQVSEAMYQYGDLALQQINTSINCKQGFDLITQAAAKGYTPAKKTLGIIYSFADDVNKLQQHNYHTRCNFSKNVVKGSKLLVEAMLEGDINAGKLLDTLNIRLATTTSMDSLQ
jgi:serine/threonine-protein kinase